MSNTTCSQIGMETSSSSSIFSPSAQIPGTEAYLNLYGLPYASQAELVRSWQKAKAEKAPCKRRK